MTWQAYELGLDDRLADLHRRVHRVTYRAQPTRRVYISKADGRQRPLDIAALEDKIVQQAVVTILQQIYEEEFRGFLLPVPTGAQSASRLACTLGRAHTEASELRAGV